MTGSTCYGQQYMISPVEGWMRKEVARSEFCEWQRGNPLSTRTNVGNKGLSMLDKKYIKKKTENAGSVTQEFNEQHKKLVEEGDVERIDENIPKSEYEKKTKRWFGEKNTKL